MIITSLFYHVLELRHDIFHQVPARIMSLKSSESPEEEEIQFK